MTDQYDYIKTDVRNSYTTNLRNNRLISTVQPLNKSIDKIDIPTRIFAVNSIAELDSIKNDFKDFLTQGFISILYDVNKLPVKIFAWSGDSQGWQEIPSVSVSGPALTDGTESEKGIVQLATHNESTALKVVQSDDPRLAREWIASSTIPTSTNVLWVDISSSDPSIKWNDGTVWKNISNNKLIDDNNTSLKSTLSSEKITQLLLSKAASNHEHLDEKNHLLNKNNPHEVKASQITDFHIEVNNNLKLKDIEKVKHSHNNKIVLDDLADINGELLYKQKAIGKGDMLKSIYDTDNKGYVDKAKEITNGVLSFSALEINDMKAKTHEHTNSIILSLITEAFTTDLKNKINNIEDSANNYIHPTTHPASIITQDINNRFVSDVEKETWSNKYTKTEIDNKLNLYVTKNIVGKASGLATLNPDGKIPIEQIPMSFKDTKVVETIADRDLLNKYSGLRVFVLDASADIKVGTGSAEYVWDGTKWITLSGFGLNNGSMQFMVDENNNELIVKVKYTDGTLKTGTISLI